MRFFNVRRLPLGLGLAGLVLGLVALALVVRFHAARAPDAVELEKLRAENQALRTVAEQLRAESAELRNQLEESGAVAPNVPSVRTPGKEELEKRIEEARMLNQVQGELSTANQSITELQGRIYDLEAAIDKAKAENKRLANSEIELKEKSAELTRVVEALQTEMKGKSDRLVSLEIAYRNVREENRRADEANARLLKVTRETEDINRTREVYLSNILRRFREVTDQYRNLTARQASSTDSDGANLPELSRIQSIISMAEEDLRQIASLNAQASRLQGGKKK